MAGADAATETELKIQLDAEGEARLRRALERSPLREGPVRTERLVSVYCDTEGGDLAREGIALRLRKAGRRWLQTVKKRPGQGSRGVFAALEAECPAPRGVLRLDVEEPTGLFRAVAARLDGAEVRPVFETRVRRTTARLRMAAGAVEVAIDRGEVIAGALSAPIREAEIELVQGEVAAIFDAARSLFAEGPVRFSTEPKSERGLRLARHGVADRPPAPRKAGDIAHPDGAGIEEAARAVLRDCFAQIADNMVVVAEADDPEGPHQLRIGLRRLRTAFSALGDVLGGAAFAPLGAEARRLGRVVGTLRDLDVLIGEVVAEAAGHGLDAAARDALDARLGARRAEARAEVRRALAAPEAARFVFDLAELIESRGWLVPSDYGQTARLATRFDAVAPGVLDRRYRKVVRRGRRLAGLDPAGLHDLRKELKKLRYSIELFGPLYEPKAEKAFLKALKALQSVFGSINDAAAAAERLVPPAGAGEDARAAWAGGWVLGTLAVEAEAARGRLAEAWRRFEKLDPFWR